MSDLSWLNPTPHAIAVYASRPLSPVAAQHSLPSGRYSLLGPDFHRLDRTSLRLAHSFDHLVGAADERQRDGQPERSRGLEIDDQLDFRRLLDRQVARLLALEDAADINPGLTIHVRKAAIIAHQAPGRGEFAKLKDRGHAMTHRQRGEMFAAADEQSVGADHETAGLEFEQSGEGGVEIALAAGIENRNVQSQCARRLLKTSRFDLGIGIGWVDERT